ncbi:alpha-ribazole phosphatase [Dyadobacter sp. LHD-138]|uniref:alpha-ribazole phosphatase n=1 Tax=Dyadobacter sp. LHD-138 TaxID=3071413 RepID=UPI0027E06CBC|nr:alpha-ribazole phosphatase [Dyadobacter sp. LHD-138]MDQ6480254.1 alpha-ribazole phosphatase [Dyadobacter sp. LHD-138]
MEIYLIRHTTPSLSPGLIYGRFEVPLMDTFPGEFEIIKSQLPQKFNAVYSSPSTRCTLLAQRITPDFITDERLTELDFGDWEGQTWDTVNETDLQVWMDDFVNVVVPGGESMVQMNARILSFWDELLTSSAQKIAVVTHGGVIRLILAYLQNVALVNAFEIKVGYGEVVKLSIPTSPDSN